ncbi:MAG: methyl-accepting chemotaxis protein [Pseudomonadota bacterium]
MKISHRLVMLTATAATALMAVGGLGLYQVQSIQTKLENMTETALPVKDGLIELSQLDDAVVSAMQDLARATNASEFQERTGRADSLLNNLVGYDQEFSSANGREAYDFAEFYQAKKEIDERVRSRLDYTETYEEETRQVGTHIARVEGAVNDVLLGIDEINRNANIEANENRVIVAQAAATQREARRLMSLLTEVRVLLYTVDASTSKFKLAPISEKLQANFDDVSRLLSTSESALKDLDVVSQVPVIQDRVMSADTGIVVSRHKMLADETGAKSAYRKVRRAIDKELTGILNSLKEVVDTTELEIIVAQSWVDKSLELVSSPDGISKAGKALISNVKDMRLQVDRLASSSNHDELASNRQLALKKLTALRNSAAGMLEQLSSRDNADVVASAEQVQTLLGSLENSINTVVSAKQELLVNETALATVMQSVKSTEAQRDTISRHEIVAIDDQLSTLIAGIESQGDRSSLLIVLISLVGAIVSVLVSLFIVRSILNRVRSAVEVAASVATGNLRYAAPRGQKGRDDEIASIENAMSDMIKTLAGSVTNIREAASSVSDEVTGINRGNTELNRRTDAQSNELKSARSSSSKINELLLAGSESLKEASGMSKEANSAAVQGQQLMRDAMATMKNIEQKANDINQITEIINSIAFQTNLLAINAAVEASRAGVAGQGFAVVATEVRELAQKSKDSAHDIRHIIDSTVTEVANGSEQVNEAAGHMQSTSGLISDVATRIENLVETAEVQVEAIADIEHTVKKLSAMNTDNVALTVKTTEAANDLRGQAVLLQNTVSAFQLPDTGGDAADGTEAKPDAKDG